MVSKAKIECPSMSLLKLCSSAKVSRGGYYKWCRKRSYQLSVDEQLILETFARGKSKWGSRRVKMHLLRQHGLIMNLKKVRRILRSLGLKATVRHKRNPQLTFAGEAHRILPNLLQQNFKIEKPDHVYSTDVTHLYYGKSQRAYLSATKDLATREIVYHSLSTNTDVALVTHGLKEMLQKISPAKRKNLVIHSDQGAVYMSTSYRRILRSLNVQQSMSRRGNCLDNAPIESFFGHLKDEIDSSSCLTIRELSDEIERYIKYYNSQRPQWDLKGKTPMEYRGSLN
ncbi:IS3 family transposase [Bdellovibrio sp. SKB1291214]|uniref:IS3 family transposase n=1 Tax=Bdellovibrio sp. SKB1291214 TaxID=1732569 RepID=UPI0020CE4916|nr:IS3 family transposase [Bdellovibrio sp. SKB1291214]UYL10770.1 IS3 family transposase [Bdellovibrio sp. SKB1291214]